MSDDTFMNRALHLARKGRGWVSPNPMVGCVIVKDGRIIGEGYHRRFGEGHAEVNAIESATESLAGAIFYVTLEPCSHYGKTPPCVDRIIETGAARVVIGTADPNPLVSGRGIEKLQEHGIEIKVGVLEEECRDLNEVFFKFMSTGAPFVTVKYAQTLDGRIATATGHSKWISSEASRQYAHELRSIHDAIMVGKGTVINDDPDLTVRLVKGRNPTRVVVDSTLQIPEDARVLRNQEKAHTIIATTSRGAPEKNDRLTRKGIEVLITDTGEDGRVDLQKLLVELGRRNISSVLVEGGSEIITSLIAARIPDRLIAIMAPKIAGSGIEAIGDLGIAKMDDSILLKIKDIFRKGDDVIIDTRISRNTDDYV